MGEGQREERWVRPSACSGFLGLKQEGRKEEGTWGGEIPESWRVIVKCLEIPQEVSQEEEGRRRLRWSHTILPGRSYLPRGPSGWTRPALGCSSLTQSAMLPRRRGPHPAEGRPPLLLHPSQEGPDPFRLCHARDYGHTQGMVRGLIYLFFQRSRGMPARDKSLGYAAPPVVTVQSQSTGQGGGGQTLSGRSRPQKRKRLLLVPPCALEASGKTRWMAPPAPTSKATRNLMVSPIGNNIGHL